jgi:hypothetical protein
MKNLFLVTETDIFLSSSIKKYKSVAERHVIVPAFSASQGTAY